MPVGVIDGDVKADLDRWFDDNYSADQMGLVVLGQGSLDELQALVEPLFNQVPNANIGPSHPAVPPFTSAQLPAQLSSKALQKPQILQPCSCCRSP